MWLILLLPLLAVPNGLAIPLGLSTVRADQIGSCLLVASLAVSALAGGRRIRIDAVGWWLAAILGANLISSAINSPAPAYSFLQCANLAAVWVLYVLVINFVDTREAVLAFVRRLEWAAIVGSVIGIGAFALASVGLDIGGAEVSEAAAEQLTRAYGAYGVMVEPNIFGSFTGAALVLSIVLIAGLPRDGSAAKELRLAKWTAGISAVGLVLSFTRAAWISTALAVIICLGAMGRRDGAPRRRRGIWKPLVVVGAVIVVLFVAPGSTADLFRFKIANLVNLQSPTAALRLLTYSLALDQTATHPIVGLGTFSFAPIIAQGTDFQQFENWRGLWIGNFALLALHDTGAIGLALWIGMLWTAITRSVRAARALRATDPDLGLTGIAISGAVISLILPFLTTTGFSLGYPWLLIGLAGAHVQLASTPTPVEESPMPEAPAALPLPADAT